MVEEKRSDGQERELKLEMMRWAEREEDRTFLPLEETEKKKKGEKKRFPKMTQTTQRKRKEESKAMVGRKRSEEPKGEEGLKCRPRATAQPSARRASGKDRRQDQGGDCTYEKKKYIYTRSGSQSCVAPDDASDGETSDEAIAATGQGGRLTETVGDGDIQTEIDRILNYVEDTDDQEDSNEDVYAWTMGDEWSTRNNYVKVVSVVDSGAAENVSSRDIAPDVPVRTSEGSRRGQHYVTANGGRVANEGEQRLEVVTEEGGVTNMTFQDY